jgi:hypothetical protein
MSKTSTSMESATLATRRALLRVACAGFSVAAGAAVARDAYSFSRQEMPAELAKQYRDRCAADSVHAPTLEAAFVRLDAMGVEYDRKEVAASLRCPICGCPILSRPGALDGPGQGPPSF